MRRRVILQDQPSRYQRMDLTEALYPHLQEIDQTCKERVGGLVKDMAQRENVTEALKASNQMEWVGRMNNILHRAEELVVYELIYED